MPTLIRSDHAKGKLPIPFPVDASAVAWHRATVSVPTGTADDDIFELCGLPANCVITDCILDLDDLDGSTGDELVIAGGIMSGEFGADDATRTVGAQLFSGLTTGQTGGVARPTLATAFRIAAASTIRGVGIEFTTDPETDAAGVMGMSLFYAAA